MYKTKLFVRQSSAIVTFGIVTNSDIGQSFFSFPLPDVINDRL